MKLFVTSLPIPRVIIMTKNNIAQSGEIGNLVTTSGYTINARPAPVIYILYLNSGKKSIPHEQPNHKKKATKKVLH